MGNVIENAFEAMQDLGEQDNFWIWEDFSHNS